MLKKLPNAEENAQEEEVTLGGCWGLGIISLDL